MRALQIICEKGEILLDKCMKNQDLNVVKKSVDQKNDKPH